MPTHGCIPCATSRARCCICAGHQHGLYGSSGVPAEAGDPDWFTAMGVQGQSRGREAAQRLLRRFLGEQRVFAQIDGAEVELIPVPAIPAKSESPKLTLWDHLLKDDV